MPYVSAHAGPRITRGVAEAKRVLRRYFEEAWGQGDTSVLDELIAPVVTVHSQYEHVKVLPPPGPQACRDEVLLYRAAFPDLQVEVVEQVAERDLVMTRWELHGTHLGELLGIAATGRPVRLTSHYFARLDQEVRIAETRNSWDALGLHQQLWLSDPHTLPYAVSTRDGAWPARPADTAEVPAARLLEELFTDVYGGRAPERAADLVHPGYRSSENLAAPASGGPDLLTGRLVALRQTVPDARCRLDVVIGEGGTRAACCWTLTGTAASGRTFSVMGSTLAEVREGRLARTWHCYDALPFLHATGTHPTGATLRLLG
ncbi:ester cyclase [Streptomyces sp. NPDC051452]|uniref:ester cyclase n=1 Tax=Streptomyces sp. NPDC051452 TaxID=3365654 RepID=UPI0037B57E31